MKKRMYISQLPSDKDPRYPAVMHALKMETTYKGGKRRIVDYYRIHGMDGFSQFIKGEYGIGGYSNGKVGVAYDGRGIEVFRYKYQKCKTAPIQITWWNVAKIIAALIEANNYLSAADKEGA